MKTMYSFLILFGFLTTSVCYGGRSSTDVTTEGRTPVTSVRTAYSSTNVTTGAWVELVASTSRHVALMDIFDSSGQTLQIGFGSAGNEVAQFLVFPGGNGQVSVNIPAATRVSIKAVSGTASAGESDINFYDF